jgi:iron complex outermembrane recepter protein
LRGAVNVPLTDDLAVRVSGFTREEAGYIDNPVLHLNGINQQDVSGGRISALWKPSDNFSIKVSALYQNSHADGVNDVTTGLGDLQQNYVRGIGANHGTVQAYSASINWLVSDIQLTSLTGYNVRTSSYPVDYSYLFASSAAAVYGAAVNGTNLVSTNDTKKVTEELRASSTIGKWADWLIGGFYTHENSAPTQDIFAIAPATGSIVADAYHTNNPSTYDEYAAFADLTVHFTDQLDVQIGGRESWMREANLQSTALEPLFGVTGPVITAGTRADENPFTYLLTPRYTFSPDFMVYARFASGYRPGGPNSAFCANNFPCQFGPDKTQNYEVGAKGDLFNQMITFDASIYYINWRNIQLFAVDPVSHFGYDGNAGAAKSQGVELALQAKPTEGLTLSAWGAWNTSELTQPFPAGGSFGVPGNRLPYTPDFSGSISAQQEFTIADVRSFVGGNVSYVGDRVGAFTGATGSPAPRQDLPGYARVDFHLGARYETWAATLYMNNAFDKRGLLDGGLDAFPPTAYDYIQPRTVGISISKDF